ncbi:MAG: hypothetical protein WBM13_06775 [Bacteroidia bacterium]
MINEKTFSNVSLIFTDFLFDISAKEKYQSDYFNLNYFSGIRDYSIKWDIDYSHSSKHYIKGGLLATNHTFRPGAIVTESSYPEENYVKNTHINTTETAIYIEDDF